LFSGGMDDASIPSVEVTSEKIGAGLNIIEALETAGLISTRSEGRRLITQGGINVNGKKVTAIDHVIAPGDFENGKLMLQKGKKIFCQLILV